MANGNGKNGKHVLGNGKQPKPRKPRQPLKAQSQHATPVDVEHEMLRAIALELRADGLSYRKIAAAINDPERMKKEFGFTMSKGREAISKDIAFKLVIEGLTDLREKNTETIEEVRKLELERCDAWLARLSTGAAKNDPRTIDTMLRISERRSKLLGLDVPVRIAGADGGPIELTLADPRAIFREKLAALQRAMSSAPVVVVPPPALPASTGEPEKGAA